METRPTYWPAVTRSALNDGQHSHIAYLHYLMGYPIRDQQGLYFLTFTVVEWLDVFTRLLYKDIVIESLGFCQRQKGLELFAYCLMTNHLHLIARAADGHELSGIVRDFKKFTARRVFEAILANPQESRRQWLEWTLRKQGEFNPKNTFIQLWQNTATAWSCTPRP